MSILESQAYFTSSKLVTTDYQRLTEALVQIRNAISILDVVPSITIDKHPCDALPILLCPFLCISFFCWCKGTNNSAYIQILWSKYRLHTNFQTSFIL